MWPSARCWGCAKAASRARHSGYCLRYEYKDAYGDKKRKSPLGDISFVCNKHAALWQKHPCENRPAPTARQRPHRASRLRAPVLERKNGKDIPVCTEEIERELQAIAATGLQEILLLTGESRTASSVEYIGEAVKLAARYFRNVGIEIYPLNSEEYRYLNQCGADFVSVYQETYNPAAIACSSRSISSVVNFAR